MRYQNNSKATWAQNVKRLSEVMAKWGIGFSDYQVTTVLPNPNTQWNSRGWAKVEYRHPKSKQVVTMMLDSQESISKNLNCIVTTIEDIYMQERRGLSGLVASHHYAALPAPVTKRDPYEVMGLRPDAPIEVAEASYRALAKAAAP